LFRSPLINNNSTKTTNMKTEEIYHNENWSQALFENPTMSKKEIEQAAKIQVDAMWEGGQVDELQALATTERNKAFWTEISTQIRKKIKDVPEKNYRAFGCVMSMSNTGDRKNYEDDCIYKDIAEQLKDRKDLLDLAFKSKDVIYDSHGAEVPKVGIKTFGSEVIKVNF